MMCLLSAAAESRRFGLPHLSVQSMRTVRINFYCYVDTDTSASPVYGFRGAGTLFVHEHDGMWDKRK